MNSLSGWLQEVGSQLNWFNNWKVALIVTKAEANFTNHKWPDSLLEEEEAKKKSLNSISSCRGHRTITLLGTLSHEFIIGWLQEVGWQVQCLASQESNETY
ncbi:hypothetical protein CEXT_339111 [Caerostris extrusa]|uniref:Uncharacterized protein n=1 Tax=Caerostris extrusa TaxID=172846 RepID=A0AAV4VDG3_CAEEX|nr:hypothetical protein CEXT_339111 [Caerostris extrusa]